MNPTGGKVKTAWINSAKRIPGRNRSLQALFVLFLVFACFLPPQQISRADGSPRVVQKQFMAQVAHWQLVQWRGNAPACDMYLQTSLRPGGDDILAWCGYFIYQDWLSTPVCNNAAINGNIAGCTGLFTRYLGQTTHMLTKQVVLPGMTFKSEAVDCSPGNWCESPPKLKLTAIEPLSGYHILTVNVLVGGHEKDYGGEHGEFELPLTGDQGAWVEYWADSNYGDQSSHIRLHYRNVQPDPAINRFRFDALSKDWEGSAPSGSLIWDMFPPVLPSMGSVLEQPQSLDGLSTASHYAFLAGHLIQSGQVNANGCDDHGMAYGGAASACGEQAAQAQVIAWQNKYDSQIYAAALKYNVPAKIVKGIIAYETQFWPTSESPYELGLGKITDNGADMLLMWDVSYFLNLCVPIYGAGLCSAGYSNLRATRQNGLRSLVLKKVGTSDEIDSIAAMLVASAAQINQMISNTTGRSPADVTTYQDMWEITVANYHAGSGCVGYGMQAVATAGQSLSWTNVVARMLGGCRSSEDYVNEVMGISVHPQYQVAASAIKSGRIYSNIR